MKAARLHEYHGRLKLDQLDEPKADGPLDAPAACRAVGS